MMTDKELLDAMKPGGYFEVRIVESERMGLLVIYNENNAPAVVMKLNDEQAHQLSVLLVQLAERIGAISNE